MGQKAGRADGRFAIVWWWRAVPWYCSREVWQVLQWLLGALSVTAQVAAWLIIVFFVGALPILRHIDFAWAHGKAVDYDLLRLVLRDGSPFLFALALLMKTFADNLLSHIGPGRGLISRVLFYFSPMVVAWWVTDVYGINAADVVAHAKDACSPASPPWLPDANVYRAEAWAVGLSLLYATVSRAVLLVNAAHTQGEGQG